MPALDLVANCNCFSSVDVDVDVDVELYAIPMQQQLMCSACSISCHI